MNGKLKVGILIDDYLLPAWKSEIIEKIIVSDFAEINVIIRDDKNIREIRKHEDNISLILRLYYKVDRFVFGKKSDYCRKRDLRSLLSGDTKIKVNKDISGRSEEYSEKVFKEIRNHDLDIVLKLGSGNLTNKVLTIPKYGVWSFSMDNYGNDISGISGFLEVVSNNPVTRSELVILDETEEKNIIISSACESTCSYSVHKNRNKLFWRASLFVPRVMNQLYGCGDAYFTELKKKYEEELCCHAGLKGSPSLIQSLKYVSAASKAFASKILKKICYTDPFSWILFFKINGQTEFLKNSFSQFSMLKPSKDKFWADPFVINKGDDYFVFVEEYIYSINKGHISVLKLNGKGELLESKMVLDKPYHMSYPFIFEKSGTYYMIPETGENRTIELYRCVEFPGKWVFEKNIRENINALDSTVFLYNGKWWLFTLVDSISFASDNSPELCLFYSDDILSEEWKSHPLNPIVSDVRNARPAGRVFIENGNIYRPSQDCSSRYGEALNFNQIITLTETEYEEKQVNKVYPWWDTNLKGIHTYNSDNNISIIDAYYFRKRLS
jgi:hypothetical protein